MAVIYTSMEFSVKVKAKCRYFKVTRTETVIFKAVVLDEVIWGK